MSTRLPSEESEPARPPTRRPKKNWGDSLRSLIGTPEDDGGTALDQFERLTHASPPSKQELAIEPVQRGREEITDTQPTQAAETQVATTQVVNTQVPSTPVNDRPPETPRPHRLLSPRIPVPTLSNEVAAAGNMQPASLLAPTHTGSEQKLYVFLLEATIAVGLRERQVTHREMSMNTGIRSDRTVKDALRGLMEKLTIEVVLTDPGNKAGAKYRVYTPNEVDARRRAAGIAIDPRTKKALPAG